MDHSPRVLNRLYLIMRILFGLMFVWASWEKLMHPEAFARVIDNYNLLPRILVNPFAIVLPWMEMGCGILLVTGFLVGGSLLVLNALLAVFAVAIGLSLYRGLDIACGCFSLSQEGEKIAWISLVRDMGMLFYGVVIALWEMKRKLTVRPTQKG